MELQHTVFEYSYQVSEQDLDSFGHMNNAHYLRLMEQARWDFITKNGYGHKRMNETQKGPVLLEVHLRFRRELKLSEHITIFSQAQEVKGKIMHLKQWIVKKVSGEQVIAAEAMFTVGFFHFTTRKLLVPDAEWLLACGYTDSVE